MTLQQLLTEGKEYLRQCEITDFELDACLLLFHVFGIDRGAYFLRQQEIVSQEKEEKYRTLLAKRGKHIPLQHITGYTEFMGLDFHVNEHVLIPRQDTETIVEEVLRSCEEKRVLDMCTGSGCIAVSIAKLGKPHSVTAVDVSDKALQVAIENAKINHIPVDFIKSDLFEKCMGKFDIIVSNPPYIETKELEMLMPEVRDYEPRLALDGKADGLYFYRRIIEKAPDFLLDKGSIFFEIGYNQREDVSLLLEKQGFSQIECKKDLAGLDRMVSAVWKKGI